MVSRLVPYHYLLWAHNVRSFEGCAWLGQTLREAGGKERPSMPTDNQRAVAVAGRSGEGGIARQNHLVWLAMSATFIFSPLAQQQ